jgi:integral membrane protein (TIGR01906 family)
VTVAARTAAGSLIENLAPWLGPPLALLFVLCVPLCFIGNNVRWVALNPDTYREGFAKYRAAERTGLDPDQLSGVARAFIDYFQAPPGRLNPTVTMGGSRRPLFNEREVAHMEDVQKLMRLVFRLGLVSALYAVAFAAGLLAWQHAAGLAMLGRLMLWGAALSLALLLLVGALSFVDFGELFVRFHQLSFRNDRWMLDPNRDYLLILFPEGFWLDVTLRIAALTAAESLALGALGFLFVTRR